MRGDTNTGAPQASIIACDFFTVETILLRRFYVLFFIAHESRRVWLFGCTRNPTVEWVIQQARNLGPTSQTRASAFSSGIGTASTAAPLTRSSAAKACRSLRRRCEH